MKNIIVYDFDKTVYNGETTIDFTKFVFKRYKEYRIKIIIYSFLSVFFLFNLKKSKSIFWKWFIKKDEKIIEEFSNHLKIFNYFNDEIKKNKNEVDIIYLISASPSFILEKIYKKLGFTNLIATDYDENMNVIGKNCKGSEKVVRLKNKVADFKIISFYSDSISDKPLYDLAQDKFYITKQGEKKLGLPKNKTFLDRIK